MSINSIGSTSSALEMLQSAAGSSPTTQTSNEEDMQLSEIKSEVKKSTTHMSAQDIVDKYGISLAEAQKILDEISKEDEEGSNLTQNLNQNTIKQDAEVPEDATVSYHVG